MAPKFFYKARDRKGALIHGEIEAADVWLARKSIAKLNLTVLDLQRFNLKAIKKKLIALRDHYIESITLEEKLFLIGQLEMGFSVGIPILQVLNLIQTDVINETIRKLLQEVIEDISQGETLHASFAKHPTLFDATVIGLIKTGEASGELEQVLGRISKMLEQKAENKAKIKSATFYPKLVVSVMVIVTGVVVYFVIPKIKSTLISMGSDLPPITKFVVGTSDFVLGYWYLILAAAFVAYEVFSRWVKTEKGRLMFDTWKLKAPVFGKLFLYLELNNFCVILDLLISSGLPLLEALETLKEAQNNENIRRDIQTSQEVISRGGTIAEGLGESKYFPASFRNLISIGEETGRIQPILQRLGRYYQVQINYRLDNLAKLLEPILLAIIFGMVTVLALAIFLPVWKLSSPK